MPNNLKPLSVRTKSLVQSDIRGVTRMINALGGINLGQGICDLPTPDPIKAGAIQAIEENQSIYTSFAGIPTLQDAILKKVQSFNRLPARSRDEVMVSIGSTGAFVASIFALLDSGDEAILFEPFYGYHRNLIALTGATLRYIPSHGTGWAIDFDEFERAITPQTKVVILNTPGNPGGKVWTKDELQTLLAILERYNLYAITDEIYEYMTYDGHKHTSLASLPEAYKRTITISGFSKTYNMTGWRLGYAIAPTHLIEKMGLLNDLFSICAPTPLQYGVAEAFSMSDSYFITMLAEYTEKRKMMCDALESAGFTFSRPQGAYYVLAGFDRLAEKHAGFSNDTEACHTLMKQAGVATVPGNSFFNEEYGGPQYLRFCYAKEFPVLKQACAQIVEQYA